MSVWFPRRRRWRSARATFVCQVDLPLECLWMLLNSAARTESGVCCRVERAQRELCATAWVARAPDDQRHLGCVRQQNLLAHLSERLAGLWPRKEAPLGRSNWTGRVHAYNAPSWFVISRTRKSQHRPGTFQLLPPKLAHLSLSLLGHKLWVFHMNSLAPS